MFIPAVFSAFAEEESRTAQAPKKSKTLKSLGVTLHAESSIDFVGFQLAVKRSLGKIDKHVGDSVESTKSCGIPQWDRDTGTDRVDDAGTCDDCEARHDEQGDYTACDILGNLQ